MSETQTKKLMLFFPKCECEKPIICELVKNHNLVVNVLRAKVTPEEEGYLVLDVTGTQTDIDNGIEYVKTFNVSINETGKGLTRDDTRCTHCGQCTAHCPTDALSIADPLDREVAFDDRRCIECLACIRVCPFGACSAAF